MAGWSISMDVRDTLLEKISSNPGYDKPMGIVAGFVPACEFVEACEIIANLAYVLARRGVVVCAVDFKVFYPNLYDWLGGVESAKKGNGLIRFLNSDRTEVREIAQETDEKNIFLIAPSLNDDIEDYLSFSIDDVNRIIAMLKEAFDVVLIDIPNNPGLEFFAGALMNCQKGFFIATERVDAPRNIQKLMEFALRITNNARNFSNVIMARQQGLVYDRSVLTGTRIGGDGDGVRLRIAANIPYSREAQQCALDGNVYIRDGSLAKRNFARAGKVFTAEIANLADMVLEVR